MGDVTQSRKLFSGPLRHHIVIDPRIGPYFHVGDVTQVRKLFSLDMHGWERGFPSFGPFKMCYTAMLDDKTLLPALCAYWGQSGGECVAYRVSTLSVLLLTSPTQHCGHMNQIKILQDLSTHLKSSRLRTFRKTFFGGGPSRCRFFSNLYETPGTFFSGV